MESKKLQFYDIAANLSDSQFQGIYHQKQKHPCDLEKLFKRSEQFNVTHLLIASGNIPDLEASYPLCKKSPTFFTTAGVHPCRANEAAPNVSEYFANLEHKIKMYQDKGESIDSFFKSKSIKSMKNQSKYYFCFKRLLIRSLNSSCGDRRMWTGL